MVLDFEFAGFEGDAQGVELGLRGGRFDVGLFGLLSSFDRGVAVRDGFFADLDCP